MTRINTDIQRYKLGGESDFVVLGFSLTLSSSVLIGDIGG